MTSIKKLSSGLLLAILLSCSSPSLGTIHTLIASDLKDPFIGDTCLNDIAQLEDKIQGAAANLDEPLFIEQLQYQAFSSKELFSRIDSLDVDPNDVILFYYTGHGWHSNWQEDPYSILALSDEPVQLLQVIHAIQEKSPRLALIIADTCNSYIPGEPRGYIPLIKTKNRAWGQAVDYSGSNYQKLFLESEGMYVFSSSKPGEYSIALQSGSLFTQNLFKSLENHIKGSEDTNWQTVFQIAAREVTLISGYLDRGEWTDLNSATQHPHLLWKRAYSSG